jgi:hypothetical protein
MLSVRHLPVFHDSLMSETKLARLSIFTPQPQLNVASHRFITNTLFDRNLICLIEEFSKPPLPLLAPLTTDMHDEDDESFAGSSICVHPLTGHLWVAHRRRKRIYVYDTNNKSFVFPMLRIKTIDCDGYPQCVRISNNGIVVVAEYFYAAISVCPPDSTRYKIGEGRLNNPVDLTINNTLQQMAIADYDRKCVDIYSLGGLFMRTMKIFPVEPLSVCWNETDNLLYIFNRCDQKIYSFDMSALAVVTLMKSNVCKGIWCNRTGVSRYQLRSSISIVYKADTKEVILSDGCNRRVVLLDHQGNQTKTFGANLLVYPSDIAFHPDDEYGQVFVCDQEKIHIIQLNKFTPFTEL